MMIIVCSVYRVRNVCVAPLALPDLPRRSSPRHQQRDGLHQHLLLAWVFFRVLRQGGRLGVQRLVQRSQRVDATPHICSDCWFNTFSVNSSKCKSMFGYACILYIMIALT